MFVPACLAIMDRMNLTVQRKPTSGMKRCTDYKKLTRAAYKDIKTYTLCRSMAQKIHVDSSQKYKKLPLTENNHKLHGRIYQGRFIFFRSQKVTPYPQQDYLPNLVTAKINLKYFHFMNNMTMQQLSKHQYLGYQERVTAVDQCYIDQCGHKISDYSN